MPWWRYLCTFVMVEVSMPWWRYLRLSTDTGSRYSHGFKYCCPKSPFLKVGHTFDATKGTGPYIYLTLPSDAGTFVSTSHM